ncbi:hypothetical protein [Hornefia butyriciproducens]|uniref:hypothetical protein n=1 Tax=Hornefia butyriciproducens TaxID=2652293 RepID=UPI0029F85DE2|nr:hypothetical protein [Hornefia butyriciproducens]MDD7019851.1 hypothetical protein [Hornefia butyriciproducens]MDY5463460.1 hypothetical protein [Hornefia butyriciproducens]
MNLSTTVVLHFEPLEEGYYRLTIPKEVLKAGETDTDGNLVMYAVLSPEDEEKGGAF